MSNAAPPKSVEAAPKPEPMPSRLIWKTLSQLCYLNTTMGGKPPKPTG